MTDNDRARRAGYEFGYRIAGPVLALLLIAAVAVGITVGLLRLAGAL